MKSAEIVAKVLKSNGIEALESVAAKTIEILKELGPELLQAEDSIGKVIGTGLTVIVPAAESVLLKLADINKDGKIG
jgi:hypothetical protein